MHTIARVPRKKMTANIQCQHYTSTNGRRDGNNPGACADRTTGACADDAVEMSRRRLRQITPAAQTLWRLHIAIGMQTQPSKHCLRI